MTARNPVVLISGTLRELPAGDTVNGSIFGEAILDFGLFGARNSTAQTTVASQASILATSIPMAFFIASSTTDHNPEEHIVAASVISLVCSMPTAGAGFTIYAVSNIGVISGQFKVQWKWS